MTCPGTKRPRMTWLAVSLSLMLGSLASTPAMATDGDPNRDGLLILLTRERPILVSIHAHVDGVRLREHFARQTRAVFQEIDTNQDGLVDYTELNANPPAEARPLVSHLAFLTVGSPRTTPQLTIDELTDWLADSADGVMQFRHQDDPVIPWTPSGPRLAGANGDLFRTVDQDSNGMITRTELLEHQSIFRDFDLNGDDAIDLIELRFDREPFSLLNRAANSSALSPAKTVLWLPTGGQLNAVGQILLTRYGTRETGMSVDRLPGTTGPHGGLSESSTGSQFLDYSRLNWESPKVIDFDLDRNGGLDLFETRALLRSGYAHLRAEIHSGRTAPSRVSLTLLDNPTEGPDEPSCVLRRVSDSRMLIQTADVTFEVAAPDGQLAGVRHLAQRQFQAANRDNNDYLDPAEVNDRSSALAVFFESADTDDDDRLYSHEWTEFLDQQSAWAGARMGIEVIEREGDFASLVDSDRDQRITHRELLVAADQLIRWSRDGSELVSQDRLPAVTLVTFGPAFTAWPASIGIPYPSEEATRESEVDSTTRMWFERLDHNHDGDVSELEFIGPDALFKQIDKNADGLIEFTEAMRYNEQFKDKPQQGFNKD